MLSLTPLLLFEGNYAEAMEIYQACLGGELRITRVGDTPTVQAAPEHHEKVAYAHLKSDLIDLSAIDWQHSTRSPTHGNPVDSFLKGGTYRKLRQAFDKLSVGVHWSFRGRVRQNQASR